ncbi:MAG TPA: hypothetical protein DCS89_19790 [Gammaproteobacteria bacterium]|jgi:carboxymethylenebutenolidase|nr:hypothetical protein [Gammaproteobacteria bacterium]HAT29267.1 hypothetical protein [Gammaproteobacteria bacterium]|tara:strand:- start:127 stop:822 length:696 start_codon:yes stop_codon:yes gene_type:complete
MCHKQKIDFFGDIMEHHSFSDMVHGISFAGSGRNIAILPDIYGLTDFYKGYASYLAQQGAKVYLANPWKDLGDDPDVTREEAFARRAKLRDSGYCDRIAEFLNKCDVDAIVGFCLGGNFCLELARRGYSGTNVSIYPLPWGMDNQDKIAPAFEYMPSLDKEVSIFMGEADYLAGPDNIERLESVVARNALLTLDLYPGSNHGFFTDIDGEDESLKANALDAINKVNKILFG